MADTSAQPPPTDAEFEDVVTFRVGETWLGVPAAMVEEFCDVSKVMQVPRAPDYVPGLLNVRGHGVPLLDLQRFLQLKRGHRRDDRSRQRVVLVRAAGMRVGLLCDQVRTIEAVPRNLSGPSRETFAGTPLAPYVANQINTATLVAPVLDVAALLEAASVGPR